jgi:hypothetical protein
MKNYWKVAVLVPFIVLCIGSYYIDAASSGYPEFYLNLKAGDEKEAEGFSLHAIYTDPSLPYYSDQLLTIRPKGSVYQSEESFWTSLTVNRYRNPELVKLQKEHRQFMRGKSDSGTYYEDDKVLGYAEIEYKHDPLNDQTHFSFIVSVDGKEQNRSSAFEVAVPLENDYRTVSIVDMQIVGRTMNLITMNYKLGESKDRNDAYTMVHLYKLDLDKKNIASDQILLTGDSENLEDPTQIVTLPETAPSIIPNRYSVFLIKHLKKGNPKDANGMYLTDKQELVYYDLQSNKLVPIQVEAINDLMNKSNLLYITYAQDKLMLTYLEDSNAVRVIRYSIAENKVMSNLTIDTNHSLEAGERLYYEGNINNRLYMMGNLSPDSKKAPIIIVADLETGKILYDGYISQKDNKPLSKLTIANILIK